MSTEIDPQTPLQALETIEPVEPEQTLETLEFQLQEMVMAEQGDVTHLEPSEWMSKVIARLPMAKRPLTLCVRCPGAIWFVNSQEVKCFCRVMRLETYSKKEPNNLQDCDGLEIAWAEMQQA